MLDKAEPGWRILERARINLISFIAFHFKKLHHTDSLWLISVYFLLTFIFQRGLQLKMILNYEILNLTI